MKVFVYIIKIFVIVYKSHLIYNNENYQKQRQLGGKVNKKKENCKRKKKKKKKKVKS